MPSFKRTGRFVTVTALAASTALSGPLAAYAQEADAPPPVVEEAPPEPAPAPPEPEAEPLTPPPMTEEPAPEPPADPAPEPEPAPAPEAAPEPEPEIAPDPAPAPTPPAAVEAAPDSGPAEAPPIGDPADLPVDDGTSNDLAEPPPLPAEPAPEPVPPPEEPATPAAPAEPASPPAEAPAPTPVPAPAEPAPPADAAPEAPGATPAQPLVPPAPPVPGAEPAAPADPAAPASPAAPPTAPVDPTAPPAAPDAVPVLPGTPPAPAAPGAPEALPGGPAPAPVAPGAPATAPGEDPNAALAPPPAEAPEPVAADIQTAPVPQGGVGASDARVQQLAQPVEIQSITAVQGQVVEAPPPVALPTNVQVVERVGDRDILSLVGAGVAGAAVGGLAAYFIRSDDDTRLRRGSNEVRYETLPRGLTRQTIIRPDGSEIVSIENEYGDVVQRSRILPNGEEVVLFYDPYAEDDTRPDYIYDAGADLPPLVLQIPRDRYIVDIAEPDEELYYETIVAPPVETVERIYSINEVRRSPRIRDKVRRIDLATINFAFGSADIEQAEVENLQALADAVQRVIRDNPSEVFLLEGHTDAVGSNVANLALSDRRAESVASALTDYFEIPAENLVTQGYGEEDLKVDTQEANRENRRVTLRRITPLVKPVVSAQANR